MLLAETLKPPWRVPQGLSKASAEAGQRLRPGQEWLDEGGFDGYYVLLTGDVRDSFFQSDPFLASG